jgi:hypothetical protein
MGDTTFTMLPDADTSRWHELLNVVQVAEVVARYFGARPDGGRTLAEYFGNVPFEWCYAHPQYERATAMELPALLQSHERLNRPIPAEHNPVSDSRIVERVTVVAAIRFPHRNRRHIASIKACFRSFCSYVVASILRSLLHAEFSRQKLFVGPIVDHPTLRHPMFPSFLLLPSSPQILSLQLHSKQVL